MHFLRLLSITAAAFVTGTSAAAIKRNSHVGNFRLFGANGCYEQNLGVWTVIDDDFKNGECLTLHPFDNNEHLRALSLTLIVPNCSMYLYADSECTVPSKALVPGECNNAADEFQAFSITCT